MVVVVRMLGGNPALSLGLQERSELLFERIPQALPPWQEALSLEFVMQVIIDEESHVEVRSWQQGSAKAPLRFSKEAGSTQTSDPHSVCNAALDFVSSIARASRRVP